MKIMDIYSCPALLKSSFCGSSPTSQLVYTPVYGKGVDYYINISADDQFIQLLLQPRRTIKCLERLKLTPLAMDNLQGTESLFNLLLVVGDAAAAASSAAWQKEDQ